MLSSTLRSWMICSIVDESTNHCGQAELGSPLSTSDGQIYGILSSCSYNELQIYTNIYRLRDYILAQLGDLV